MIKAIRINNDQSVELNGSAGWFLVYREYFGHDILPDIMPILESGLTMAVNLLQGVGIKNDGTVEASTRQIVESIDDSVLSDLFINLSGLESVTVMQIIWAMAKNADDGIPNLREWLNQFDCFPLDEILPKAVRLIIDSTVSAKNAKRLLTLKKLTAGLHLSESSSQESTED